MLAVVEVQQGVPISRLLADGVDYQAAPGTQACQGLDHRGPRGGGVDDRVQRLRRPLRGVADPVGKTMAFMTLPLIPPFRPAPGPI